MKKSRILGVIGAGLLAATLVYGKAALFSSDDGNEGVLLLRQNIDLYRNAWILSGEDDPTSTAKNAEKGSLYMRLGSEGGSLFVKQDDGETTNWTALSSGGGTSGEANTASNLGGGTGIYEQKVGVDLQFNTIEGGQNITLSELNNVITISNAMTSSDIEHNDTANKDGGDGSVYYHLGQSTFNSITALEKTAVAYGGEYNQIVGNVDKFSFEPSTETMTVAGLSYPNVDGTDGQVLKTNGSGTLSWTNLTVSGDVVHNETSAKDGGDGTYWYHLGQSTFNDITAIPEDAILFGKSDGTIDTDVDNITYDKDTTEFTVDGMTYPTTDGTLNQVLTTNGSGTLGWSTVENTLVTEVVGGFFGTGRDGTSTFTSDYKLTRDMFWENLTIKNGASVFPSGYKIFVSDTLTLTANTKISRKGTFNLDGANGKPGGLAPDEQGQGGQGGQIHIVLSNSSDLAGSICGGVSGNVGGDGGDAPFDNDGNAGNIGGNGASSSNGKGYDGVAGAAGGTGGGSGQAIGANGGTGGAAGAGGGNTYSTAAFTGIGIDFLESFTLWKIIADDYTPRTFEWNAGSGASGGGGAGGGDGQAWGGGGGGGGASGDSGGCIYIAARKLVMHPGSAIDADGGDGGNGGNGGKAQDVIGGNGAGGGAGGAGGSGGPGGIIVLVTGDRDAVQGDITASGGSKGYGGQGGAGFGTGANGAAGNDGEDGHAGTIYYFDVKLGG